MMEKAQYTRLEQQVRRRLALTSEALLLARVTRQRAYATASAEITAATVVAFQQGKGVGIGKRAISARLTAPELARAKGMAANQCARLRSWLLSTAPLQPPGVQGVGPRLDMYGLSLHAAYQTGLAFGLLQAASAAKGMALMEDDPIWLWKRSQALAVASCTDCIAREARARVTPYSLTELLTIGFPAQGHTKCLTRCRCHIELIPGIGSGLAAEVLKARAHRRAKPTAYHGVVSPDVVAILPKGKVGPGR